MERKAILRHGQELHGVGQFIRQGENGGTDGFVSFRRAGDVQGSAAGHGVHRLQKAGQTEHVVAMIVGQRDQGDLHRADVLPVERQLGAFAAVQQDVPPVHGKHCAAQGAVGLGKGSSGSKQGHGQHGEASNG